MTEITVIHENVKMCSYDTRKAMESQGEMKNCSHTRGICIWGMRKRLIHCPNDECVEKIRRIS